jgi:hypothetical protein
MVIYRLKRNILKSLKDYLQTELLEDNWSDISVEFQTKKSITLPSPKILISILDTANQKREIGSGKYLRFPNIVIRIFGTDGGNREDLSDWINEKLEENIPYYQYKLSNGQIISKELAGNMNVLKILRDEHELANTPPENLEEEDRYRHNITFSCYVGLI